MSFDNLNEKTWAVCAGLVWCLAAMPGCGSEPSAAEERSEPEVDVVAEAAPVNVTVLTLEPTELSDRVNLAGRLDPWVEVDVSTELGGTVQEVGFEKGRRVQKGQVLARVGSDLLEANLLEAEAELVEAEAHFNKTKELYDRQAVPRQDFVSATSLHKRAQARRTQSKLRLERSIITAPISGVAVSREVEPGEVLNPGALVTTLHRVDKLKAVTGIPEDDIAFFRTGSNASVEVDAYPGRHFEGKIYFLSPAATGKNRSFPAEVELDNRSGELRPGMIVRMSLTKKVFEDVVVAPRDAILERDTGTLVFVLEEGRARQRMVASGPSEGGNIVILDGLKVGEQLIVTGHRSLVDGQRVRVVGGGEAN